MKQRFVLLGILFCILAHTAVAAAGPILKPHKYHGPIPRNSFTFKIGFLGGADNQEMIDYLDGRIKPPFEAFSEDFSNALSFDGTIMRKLHPQFAVRGTIAATFLRSDGNGIFVPARPVGLPDTILVPAVEYTRDFDVDLFVLEASAVYFFSDASVNEFQPYFGGGFSFGVPHAKYNVTQVVASATDEFYTKGDIYAENNKDTWGAEAGVHGILGASYYIRSSFAFVLEGRYQIMQSKFPLEVANEDGLPEEVKFVVNYEGFTLNFGITYAF